VVLALAFFAFCMMLWILYGWFPTFIYEHFHLSLTSSGVNATLYLQAATIAGILVGGAVGDMLVARVPAARFYVGAVGLFVCGPFGCLALVGSSLSQARIASALFGFFAGLMIANVFSGAFDVVAQENYSFAAGFLNLVGGLSGGMGLLLSGWWNHTIGLLGLMRWAAAGSACMAVLMVVVGVRGFEKDHGKAMLSEPVPNQ
jgi:MFS family permease